MITAYLKTGGATIYLRKEKVHLIENMNVQDISYQRFKESKKGLNFEPDDIFRIFLSSRVLTLLNRSLRSFLAFLKSRVTFKNECTPTPEIKSNKKYYCYTKTPLINF